MDHTETGTHNPSSSSVHRRTDRDSTTDESAERDRASLSDLELLIVGTLSGGGIHRYIEEQVDRLQGTVSVETHDMASPPPGTGLVRFVWGAAMGLVALARFPFRDRPDVAHVHTSHRFSFYRASVYVLFMNYVWGIPIVLHIHGSSFDEFVATDSQLVAALQRHVFGLSDEIIVLSPYWKDTVSVRADADRIRVVPNAVDPSSFPVDDVAGDQPSIDRTNGHSPGGATDVPHIVFVSNLVERKGVRELAAAVERLSDARPGQFRVTIAGDGPLSDRIEQLASEHEHVSYLGYVSEERKRSLLAEGSIYVLPTYAEGLPIAMLEGMAGRNAIVSTSVGSIPEVIDDSRGLLVEPGDVDALTDALETLVSSPDRRARMAANNRRAIESEYSWDEVLEELLEIYETHA